jgi:uridine kinase
VSEMLARRRSCVYALLSVKIRVEAVVLAHEDAYRMHDRRVSEAPAEKLDWDNSVKRISEPPERSTAKNGWNWLPFHRRRRSVLLVLGASGAGKTELWQLLTRQPAKDQLSKKADAEFYFGKTKRSKQALITIPGQWAT